MVADECHSPVTEILFLLSHHCAGHLSKSQGHTFTIRSLHGSFSKIHLKFMKSPQDVCGAPITTVLKVHDEVFNKDVI